MAILNPTPFLNLFPKRLCVFELIKVKLADLQLPPVSEIKAANVRIFPSFFEVAKKQARLKQPFSAAEPLSKFNCKRATRPIIKSLIYSATYA
jgi:hypothetical protein